MISSLRRFIFKGVMSGPFLPVRSFIVTVYYRLIFGRRVPFRDFVEKVVRAFELCHGAGDIPYSSEVWESQYRIKYWDFLKGIDEVAHYSVLAGYFRLLKPSGSVLDVGCGEGNLLTHLASEAYSRYVGIDISETAISIARKNESQNTLFLVADVTCYVPSETFDTIVFNESLYCFEDPLSVFHRYTRVLRDKGVLLTSFYMTERASAILQKLKHRYSLLYEVSLTNQKNTTWVCSVFNASANPYLEGSYKSYFKNVA